MPTHPAGRHRSVWGEFLALPENQSALQAARSLAHALTRPAPRVSITPLVFHGPSGSGKSHLIRTLVAKLIEAENVVTVQSIAAADLARGDAAEGSTLVDDSLRDCDLLVLEDLHHLPSKAADAVCELLDRRSTRRRASVITMLVGPALLTHLPRRLTTRLAAGLVLPLAPLSPTSRKKVLKVEAKRQNVNLTADAIDWLAQQATGGGLRPMLGKLNVLATLGKPFPLPLDRARVEELLSAAGQPMPAAVTPAEIVKRVAQEFAVPEKEMFGPSRLRQVRLPRQVAMYLVRQLTNLSLPRIGSFFDGRDHTTVLHACRKVRAEMASDELFAARVNELMALMR